MERYLDSINYAQEANKPRSFYEELLSNLQSCEFEHSPKEIPYSYSKFIVKKIISSDEWGLSTLKEQEVRHPVNGFPLRFNFWDYIQAFNKVLFYENPKRKHTWFLKVCHKVQNLPNWFIQWWQFYGPSEKILMDPLKTIFEEWVKCSLKLKSFQKEYPEVKNIDSILFFTEFSIPWILKWDIDFGTNEHGLPCLERKFYTKFWKKMVDIDTQTQKIFGQDTIDQIQQVIKQDKLKAKAEEKKAMPDLFKQIAEGKNLSQEEMIKEYLQTMKKDLIKNISSHMSRTSSSSSMDINVSAEGSNKFEILAGESQDPYEDDSLPIPMNVNEMFEVIQENLLAELQSQKKE